MSTFLKNSFKNTIRVSNCLDQNCLQSLSADDASSQRVEGSHRLEFPNINELWHEISNNVTF